MLLGAGAAALVTASALFLLGISGAIGGDDGPTTIPLTTFEPPLVRYLTPEPTATAIPSDAPIQALAIPRFGVDAPIIELGTDPNGIMESPDGAWEVAWYRFSARPGFGSNAVFSGHVDYIDVGPAVFWNLKDLVPDDVIEVHLEDGTVYRYAVSSMEAIDAQGAPIGEIVADTPKEIITLITCGGTFDPTIAQYDQRLIVRADRIYEDAADPSLDAAPR